MKILTPGNFESIVSIFKHTKIGYPFTMGFSRISKSIHKLSELYGQANNALKLTSSNIQLCVFDQSNRTPGPITKTRK